MSRKTKTTATKEEAKPTPVPKLRFPEFNNAAEWNTDGLGKVVDFVKEKVPLEQVALENYISTENILPDYGGVAKASKLPTTGSVTRYKPNDTLVSNIRPYLKKVWVADRDGGASNDVIVIRAKQRLLPQYFSCLLKNDAFIDYVMTGAKGVKMPRGDISSMKAYPTLYPSKPEQQKIAECLSSVDDLIAAQARKVDALKTHKKGLMQQLFPREGETQPRLRFPEFRKAGEWEEKALAEIVQVASGQVDPTQPPYKGFPQIGSENIESNTGKLVNVKSAGEKGVISGNYLFDEQDILYSKIRPALNKAAAPNFKGICSADIYPIRPTNDALLRSYLLYLLLSDKFLEHAIRSSDRGKIPKINREDLLGYVTAIPKPPEQQRIADCLSNLDALITAETQKQEALKTHKKALMQQLFPSTEEVAG